MTISSHKSHDLINILRLIILFGIMASFTLAVEGPTKKKRVVVLVKGKKKSYIVACVKQTGKVTARK